MSNFNRRLYYYDESGNIKYYNLLDYEKYAPVYKISRDECLKRFGLDHSTCNIEVLKKIRELDLPNFYKILEFLFDKDNNFVAYTMKHYDSTDKSIITMPSAYTLDNFYTLVGSFNILTDNDIAVDDLHSFNAIIGEENMTLIDADLYYFNYTNNDIEEKKKLSKYNLKYLLYLFSDIYGDAIIEVLGYDVHTTRAITSELFNGVESIDNISKKLTKYKYPIDYIKDIRKTL